MGKRKHSSDPESGDEEEVDQVVASDVEANAPGQSTKPADEAAGSAGATASSAAVPPVPEKKRRGRPIGSKNKAKKPNVDGNGAIVDAEPAEPPKPKRGRGRPPKPRTPEQAAAEAAKALLPKRPRGRPPKKPRTDDGPSGSNPAEASSSTDKKPRGRPKKSD